MQLSTKAAKIIFLLTTIVLLGLSALLYRQITSLLDSQEQVSKTHLLQLKLEQLLSALVNTETAQRGYLITKDSVFLEPYSGAYGIAKNLLKEINTLAPGTDYDRAKFNALQTFVEVKFGSFHHPFGEMGDTLQTADLRKNYLLRAKANMDSIRYYMQEIEGRANELLQVREEENRMYTFLTPFYAILLIVFSIVILVFSYERILKQLKRTKQLLFRLKKLNNKLKQQNYQLELTNRELDSFTYIASHDLKEPLRKIMTYISLITKNGSKVSGADNQMHLQKISSFAERMQNLLDDLLQYSHASQSEKTVEDVDLNKSVGEVVQNLHEEISETRAEIKYDSLPVIKGMPFQIRQLFQNLISNSLKYRQPATPPVITITSSIVSGKEIENTHHKMSQNYVRLLFRDNGIGFNQSYADKVFRLFQRLHTTGDYKGTGIGLTICKKVVDNHHGFIKVVSAENVGTTFEIYFPF
jgi:signal transduction histidine kinase